MTTQQRTGRPPTLPGRIISALDANNGQYPSKFRLANQLGAKYEYVARHVDELKARGIVEIVIGKHGAHRIILLKRRKK